MKKLIIGIFALTLPLLATAQVPLAGVYEGQMNDNITRKRMYLDIDFINGVPDFTQTFTEKTAPLKILPSDFMNAKKLKKDFKGTTAPAFARYNSKTLFSFTEEIKITNPVLEDGVLMADWINNEGKKGRCFIVVNPDRSLRILGMTSLDRDLGPDNLVMTLVNDKVPSGVTPYITPADKLPLIEKRYLREFVWKPKVDKSNGIPNTNVTIDPAKVRRAGNSILVYPQWTNKNSKGFPMAMNHNPFDRNEFAIVNGDMGCNVSIIGDLQVNLPSTEPVTRPFIIRNVPLNAEKIDILKIQGRAQDSPRSTEKNPYGEFEYKFSNIVLPELRPSNYPDCFVTDTDLILEIVSMEKQDKNFVISFKLTNDSNRDKDLFTRDGIAKTTDGEEIRTECSLPKSLPAGDTVKGTITVPNVGNDQLRVVRQAIHVNERQVDFDCIIQIS